MSTITATSGTGTILIIFTEAQGIRQISIKCTGTTAMIDPSILYRKSGTGKYCFRNEGSLQEARSTADNCTPIVVFRPVP